MKCVGLKKQNIVLQFSSTVGKNLCLWSKLLQIKRFPFTSVEAGPVGTLTLVSQEGSHACSWTSQPPRGSSGSQRAVVNTRLVLVTWFQVWIAVKPPGQRRGGGFVNVGQVIPVWRRFFSFNINELFLLSGALKPSVTAVVQNFTLFFPLPVVLVKIDKSFGQTF